MLLADLQLHERRGLPHTGAQVTGRRIPEDVSSSDGSSRLGSWVGAALRPISLWCLLLVGSLLLLQAVQWRDGADSVIWWLSSALDRIGVILPFVLFASGVALFRVCWDSSRALRNAAQFGIGLSVLCYLLAAWVEPTVQHRYLVSVESATAARTQFGPQNPVGLIRNLRHVEDNPPQTYGLSVDTPERHPPNVLRWLLHRPAALAVFGLLNVFLGVLAAQLTANLRRRARRNARVTIGVLGGVAFLACVSIASPIEPFLRDGTLRPGVLSAWAPLALPLAEAWLLYYLIRRRRG